MSEHVKHSCNWDWIHKFQSKDIFCCKTTQTIAIQWIKWKKYTIITSSHGSHRSQDTRSETGHGGSTGAFIVAGCTNNITNNKNNNNSNHSSPADVSGISGVGGSSGPTHGPQQQPIIFCVFVTKMNNEIKENENKNKLECKCKLKNVISDFDFSDCNLCHGYLLTCLTPGSPRPKPFEF